MSNYMDMDSMYYEAYEKQYGSINYPKNNETKKENKICNTDCELKEYNKGIDIFENPKETIEFLNKIGVDPVLVSPFGIKKDKIEYRLFIKYDMSSEFQTRGADRINKMFNEYMKLSDGYGNKLAEIESMINVFGLEYKWKMYSIDGMIKR